MAREYRFATQGKGKSSQVNSFKSITHTTNTSASGSTQLAAQQVLRFGVGEFASLAVKCGWPEFRSTFRATPTKACNRAPFQEVGAAQVRRNFATSEAWVRAIVGGEAGLTQEV